MTSRADRLRSAIGDAGTDDVVAALAGMPVPAVDRVVAALRQARRSGRLDEAAARKQKRRNRPKRDDDWVAASATAMAKSLATRAGFTLETLSLLKAFYDDGPRMLGMAVDGARAQGYSDAAIGRALGVTPQAVGGRYGPRKPARAHDTGPAENAAEPQDQLDGWVRSGHARCLDPPEGCGRHTEQWNGKGPAVIHHADDCPVDAQLRADEAAWERERKPFPQDDFDPSDADRFAREVTAP